MQMRSVMSHAFGQIPSIHIPRSSFNRSHKHLTTFDAGYLIPILVDEALPGDTINLKMTAFARLSTPIKPVMDNMFLDSFFFAIPKRLLWTNFKRFMGEQDNPTDSISYIYPYIDTPAVTGHAVGSLFDYMGFPTGIPGLRHNALFSRAYSLTYNTWFRDENLINSAVVDLDDGPDTASDYVLRRSAKRPDYFTSCLPWPQKGTAVSLPLGTTAPINFTPGVDQLTKDNNGTLTYAAVGLSTGTDGVLKNDSSARRFIDLNHSHYVDLTSATAATINSLRQAFQMQKLFERDARGGTRYIELVRSHFGVISPDARQQRPEYLGGGTTPVNIHPIAQTSSTDATTPQGNLAAMGTIAVSGHGFTKSFTEHSIILGLVRVRADLTYQQGLDRMFSRSTRYDEYWPELANIGEQAVLNKEIYAQGSADAAADAAVFGYIPRYDEYRYKKSLITGKFRSTYATSLDVWHLSQEFSSLPTLGQTFIEENPPIARVVQVPAEPHFIFDATFDQIHVRPMPIQSVPGLIDHF